MSISLFRSIASQYHRLRHVNTVSMMNVLSHQIEDQIIQHQLPVDLYAGFQRFSYFPEQMQRYSQLGALCRRVYVFGVADYQPPGIPGVEFIEIAPTSPLAQEWFLLVNTSDFWVTLVAKELLNREMFGNSRRFDGLFSYDEAVVDRISLLVSQILEIDYQPITYRNYSQQSAHISEINNRMLSVLEQSERISQRRWARLHTMQKITDLTSRNALSLLQSAAQIMHDVFGATGVAIALKAGGDQYTVPVTAGDASGRGCRLSLDEGISGRTIQQGRLIQLLDPSRKFEGDLLLPTAQILMSAPIANRQIYGALTVGHSQADPWTEEDAQMLMTIAKILATQIEQCLQVSPNSLAQGSTRQLQKFIDEQLQTVERLLELQRRLRGLSGLTTSQTELLAQIESTYADLARSARTARTLMTPPLSETTSPR